MRSNRKALIVFVKEPVQGKVKTRLQPGLGPQKTLKAYKSFVNSILKECSTLKGVDRFLACDPSAKAPYLKSLARKYNMRSFDQWGKDLHDRQFNAFRDCADMGYKELVLIGSDLPTLPMEFIKEAFSELKRNDFVMGPAFDEGVWLLGLPHDKIDLIANSFVMDTGRDMSMILNTLDLKKIRLHLLPFWYDIDDINDYNFLKAHLKYLNKKMPL